MRWVLKDRGEGKTTELVAWAKEAHKIQEWPFWTRVILVATRHDAIRLETVYHVDRLQAWSLEDWHRSSTGRWLDHVELALDDVDTMLPMLLGRGLARIGLASLTVAKPAGTVTIAPGGLEAEKDPDDYPHRICNNDLNGHVAHFYTTKFSDHGPSYDYYCPGLNFGTAPTAEEIFFPPTPTEEAGRTLFEHRQCRLRPGVHAAHAYQLSPHGGPVVDRWCPGRDDD